ncbi:hypothetical protein [Leifsonia sp. Leaf264]|uniref:hypothetical protein n=1 Tax=Leifsonia sp. Leaf264 TaxID=1736314 RepID=UPI0012FA6E9B|nr:hypothetical protein [Leifsonia sp. Leaf264]
MTSNPSADGPSDTPAVVIMTAGGPQLPDSELPEHTDEKVQHVGAGPDSWAWVIRRQASRTQVLFPATGRTGWYSDQDLQAYASNS